MKYSSTMVSRRQLKKTVNVNRHENEVLRCITKTAGYYRYDVVFADRSLVILDKTVDEEHTIIQISMKDFAVTTTIDHPVKGRTKLLREGIRKGQVNLLTKIISNPRTHCPKYIKSTYQ